MSQKDLNSTGEKKIQWLSAFFRVCSISSTNCTSIQRTLQSCCPEKNTAASKFEVITTVSLPHPPPSDLSPNSTPYFLISQIMQIGKDSWGNQPGCCAEWTRKNYFLTWWSKYLFHFLFLNYFLHNIWIYSKIGTILYMDYVTLRMELQSHDKFSYYSFTIWFWIVTYQLFAVH